MDDITPAHELSGGDEAKAAYAKAPFDNSVTVPMDQAELMVDMVTKMHAKYLYDDSLAAKPWLLGAEMLRTKGKVVAEYAVTFMFVCSTWKKTRAHVVAGDWLVAISIEIDEFCI